MKIMCCCCGKQALDRKVSEYDERCTILYGAKAGFNQNECICGYCAKGLDENGMFPEEAAQCYGYED